MKITLKPNNKPWLDKSRIYQSDRHCDYGFTYIAIHICASFKFLFSYYFVWIVIRTWLFLVGLVVIAGWIFASTILAYLTIS